FPLWRSSVPGPFNLVAAAPALLPPLPYPHLVSRPRRPRPKGGEPRRGDHQLAAQPPRRQRRVDDVIAAEGLAELGGAQRLDERQYCAQPAPLVPPPPPPLRRP